MKTEELFIAKHAIETLANRDGVSPDVIRGYIQEAIDEARKNAEASDNMIMDGAPTSPDELVLWCANMVKDRNPGTQS